MEKTDIILWVLSGGFGLMLVMWHFINNHMEKQDKKFEKLDERFNKIDERFSKLDERFSKIDERFNSLETRIAIIETRLTDIANNVSHLMWHHQTLSSKDAEEQ